MRHFILFDFVEETKPPVVTFTPEDDNTMLPTNNALIERLIKQNQCVFQQLEKERREMLEFNKKLLEKQESMLRLMKPIAEISIPTYTRLTNDLKKGEGVHKKLEREVHQRIDERLSEFDQFLPTVTVRQDRHEEKIRKLWEQVFHEREEEPAEETVSRDPTDAEVQRDIEEEEQEIKQTKKKHRFIDVDAMEDEKSDKQLESEENSEEFDAERDLYDSEDAETSHSKRVEDKKSVKYQFTMKTQATTKNVPKSTSSYSRPSAPPRPTMPSRTATFQKGNMPSRIPAETCPDCGEKLITTTLTNHRYQCKKRKTYTGRK